MTTAAEIALGQVYDQAMDFKSQLLADEAGVMRDMASRWAGSLKSMSADMKDLTKQIAKVKKVRGEVPQWLLRKEKRYKSLMAQAAQEYGRFAQYADPQVHKGVKRFLKQGVEDGQTYLDLMGVDRPVLSFDILDQEAFERMVGVLQDGSPVRDALVKRFPDDWAKVEQELLHGMNMGYGPDDIVKRMMKKLNGGLYDAMRLTRTEMLRAYRESCRVAYEDSGVVTAYKRVGARDNKTCIACIMLDGRKYPLRQPLSDHPNGRCTLIPVVQGMPEVPWQKGAGWFKKLDDDDQKKILGPRRWDAWKDGQFSLESVARELEDPKWGLQVGVRSIDDAAKQTKKDEKT